MNFGNDWTERKLECRHKYLQAYRTIFTENRNARFFQTRYVDAFAGTGSRLLKNENELQLQIYQDKEAQSYRDGSAKIALGLKSPFDNYLFIEKSRRHAETLRNWVQNEREQLFTRCDFRVGDANKHLKEWCSERNWKKERAVVFLDPHGMQVEWSTIEVLSSTEGVDLWYLIPAGDGCLAGFDEKRRYPCCVAKKTGHCFRYRHLAFGFLQE